MQSKKLIELSKKFERSLDDFLVWACPSRFKEAGIELTQVDVNLLNDAQKDLSDAIDCFRSVYGKKIGEAVIHEIRLGQMK